MSKILSFGAGVQTTALVILLAEGKVIADEVCFANTGGERPETYWYMDSYVKPLLQNIGKPLTIVRSELPSEQPDLYGFLWNHRDIPRVQQRRCSDHFKIRPIRRRYTRHCEILIGFSTDEAQRANRGRSRSWDKESYPLIELGLSATDCRRIIADYGWPVPIKSSCFFCPFQPPFEWQWLKSTHPDLFQKALELEARYHERKPQYRDTFGIYRGLPLRHIAEGQQYSMGLTLELSCWNGACSH